MPVVRKLSIEQEIAKKKYDAVEALARKAGFDEPELSLVEFSLIPFFNLIVEECAKSVWEETGCKHSANAVRDYGKNIGNK